MDEGHIGDADTGRGKFLDQVRTRRHIKPLTAEEPGDEHGIETPFVGLFHQVPGQILRVGVRLAVHLQRHGSDHFIVELPGQGDGGFRFF